MTFDNNRRPFNRTPRAEDGSDRPRREFNSNGYSNDRSEGDRPARSFNSENRGDRPARSFGDRPSGDRPSRPFGDRPSRPFGDRPSRPFGERSDRPRMFNPEGRTPREPREQREPREFVPAFDENGDAVRFAGNSELYQKAFNAPDKNVEEIIVNADEHQETTFEMLGLHPSLLNTLTQSGYTKPTSVQAVAIPNALTGRDLLVSSHTGSGKTAAFVLPMIQSQHQNPQRGIKFLILTPTRELALQIEQAIRKYAAGLKSFKAVCLVGGASFGFQLKQLSQGADVIIATPGRLIDHLNGGRLDLSGVQQFVLDEADRMLDMGFIEDIENVSKVLPATYQTLLFSATLDGQVGKIAQALTENPLRITVPKTIENRADIQEITHFSDDIQHKYLQMDRLLSDTEIDQAVIFVATKKQADELFYHLRDQGHRAASLHGDMNQAARNRTILRLRQKQVKFLVATDVAARGIDVPNITHVYNFDLPRHAEDYIHRIGRTGRAGRSGIATSLISIDDVKVIRAIQKLTNQIYQPVTLEGLEPQRNFPDLSQPEQRRGGGGNRRPGGGNGGRRFGGGGGGGSRFGGGNSRGGEGTQNGDRRRSSHHRDNGRISQPRHDY